MKKVVLQERSGLWRIVGEQEEPKDILDLGTGPFYLLAVRPRYILYREGMIITTGRFSDFHPQQV